MIEIMIGGVLVPTASVLSGIANVVKATTAALIIVSSMIHESKEEES